MQSLMNSWRWNTREILLTGGFCCELTPEERNRWHLLADAHPALMAYHLAVRDWEANHTKQTYEAWRATSAAMYVVGRDFFVVIVLDRERADAKEKAKRDEEEAARLEAVKELARPKE